MVGNDPYWIQFGHTWRARSDLRLLLTNEKVLLGPVTTWSSRAGDGAAESVLVVAWCHSRVLLVMTLPSNAGDDTAESMLVVAHQVITANRQGAAVDRLSVVGAGQGATVDHQSAAVNHKGVIADRQGAAFNRLGAVDAHQGAAANHHGASADCHGAFVDRKGVIIGHQGAANLAVLRPKRLSLWDVLIVETIDLDVWIFTLTLRWVPIVMIYKNDLE
jgi:hypothetical protein